MDLNEFQRESKRTYVRGRIPNHALGLVGEWGEVDALIQSVRGAPLRIAERIKKDIYHRRPIDPQQLADELGDILWYLSSLATDYDLSLAKIAQANVAKLRARYPDGFVTGGGIRGAE